MPDTIKKLTVRIPEPTYRAMEQFIERKLASGVARRYSLNDMILDGLDELLAPKAGEKK